MAVGLTNANPVIYVKKETHVRDPPDVVDEYAREPIDQQEIFATKHGNDPECFLLKAGCVSHHKMWKGLVFKRPGKHLTTKCGKHIRDIKDPEYPYSLEELKVVSEHYIEVDDERSHVRVLFTPTVGHCSLAKFIGLCIRVKLMRSLPSRFKVDIFVAPGTHEEEASINKRLNDKECVAAALETNLLKIVEEHLYPNF